MTATLNCNPSLFWKYLESPGVRDSSASSYGICAWASPNPGVWSQHLNHRLHSSASERLWNPQPIHIYLTRLMFRRIYFWITPLNRLECLKPISQRSKYATSGQREPTTQHWNPSCCLRPEDQDLHHRTVSIVLTRNFKLMLQKSACVHQQLLQTSKN